jgi:hypothetical protein
MATILWRNGGSARFEAKKVQAALGAGWFTSKEESLEPISLDIEETSDAYTLEEADPIIRDLKTIDEVEKFCIGDPRDGIQHRAARRIKQLSK